MRKPLKGMVGALTAALMASVSTQAMSGDVLIVNGSSATSETFTTSQITNNLTTKLEARGNTVTVTDGIEGALSGYSQVWDLRFSNASLAAADQTSLVEYIQGGGNLFVMGENDNFPLRNTSVLSLIEQAGGGTITLDSTVDSSTQTLINSMGTVTYSAPNFATSSGTGSFLSFDGAGNGSAISWETGTLTNASQGALATVFDVNFMDDTALDGEEALFNLILDLIESGVIVVEDTVTTDEVQESIVSETTRVTVRAIARQVAAAIQNRVRTVASGGVLQAMRDGKSTGLNAGDGISMPIAIWVDATYSSLDNDSPTEAFDGDTLTSLVGVDVVPFENFVVGVAVGVETTDLDLSTSNGDKETDGVTGFVYAGYQFNEYVGVDALAGYGAFSTDLSEQRSGGGVVTGDYDSNRYLFSANLNGTYQYDQVLFTGTVGYLFTQENVDSYTASDGVEVDPGNTNLGQGVLGLEVGYVFDTVYPYIRGQIENDFVTESGADSTGGNIGAGVFYSPMTNLTLGANTSYDVGREDETNFSIGVSARYQF